MPAVVGYTDNNPSNLQIEAVLSFTRSHDEGRLGGRILKNMKPSDVAAPIIHKSHEAIGFLLCCEAPTTQAKMSTNQKNEESDELKTEEVEVTIVPEGTFAGTREKPILVKKGEPQPEDTGDQGGGQN
jgi:hypothetical protein